MFCVITDTWTGGAAAGRALGPAETDGPSIIPIATDSATRTEPTSRDARTPSSMAQVTEQWNSRRGSLLVGERLRRWAGTDQVAVAVRLVDAGDRRPVLVGVRSRRERRDLPRVGPVPVADDRAGGVRCAAQRRLLDAPLPSLHLVDLGPDREHRVAKAVDLAQILGLGGLDHQRSRDREGHRRRVEAVVYEPFGHVVDGHPRGLGEAAQVQDALVG